MAEPKKAIFVYSYWMVCGHAGVVIVTDVDNMPKVGSFQPCHECPRGPHIWHKKVVYVQYIPDGLLDPEFVGHRRELDG